MPRYFFDTHDGDCLIPNGEGHELNGMAAVRAEALDALSSIARGPMPKKNQEPMLLTVRDKAWHIVFRAVLAIKTEDYATSIS